MVRAATLHTRAKRVPSMLAGVVALSAAMASTPTRAEAKPESKKSRAVLEVGNPDFRAYPVAVPQIRAMGAGVDQPAETVTEALRWDLGLSPIFNVLDPRSYIPDPKKEGLVAAAIKFSDWVNVGAEGLIKGAITAKGSTIRVDFRFYDVGSGRELHQKTYSGNIEDARKFAHQWANEVVYFLTGSKGVFTTRVVAVKKTRNGRELVSMDLDGKNRRRVTKNGSINLLPSWSHNGQEIIFTSYMRHNPNLYKVASSGGKARLLSGERGLNTGGVMSPDGTKIALTLSRDGNSEIYLMNSNGSNLRRLTNEWAIDTSPSWSPDGKRIAFVSSRWGDPHIFVMNADGSKVRRLTDRGTYNQTPDWSPKGDLIAFTARDERNKFDLFTVHPETKEIRRLTQDEGHNEEPSFSPDGNHIVFTSTREGKRQVWIMTADGSNQRRVTQEGGFTTPAWSPYLK